MLFPDLEVHKHSMTLEPEDGHQFSPHLLSSTVKRPQTQAVANRQPCKTGRVGKYEKYVKFYHT